MTGRTNAAGGVRLPELVNPAGAGQILSGYEAINADGEAMVGTLVVQEPVYGIYNDPAQYVDFSNGDYSLNYLKITLPTPIKKVLGLNVMYMYNGLRAVMCYPATDSGTNESPYPSEADGRCGVGRGGECYKRTSFRHCWRRQAERVRLDNHPDEQEPIHPNPK